MTPDAAGRFITLEGGEGAGKSTQIARLKKRNRLSRAEALRRIKSQMPLADKRRRADYTLSGTCPFPQLKKQVRLLYQSLRALA